MSLKKCVQFLLKILFRRKPTPKISILIPFSSNDPVRKRNFAWLLKYWKCQLPDAEIIIGHSKSKIFCKSEAFNDAAMRAKGEIFVLLDADAYIQGKIISKCADRILEELRYGNHIWYIPYRNLWRLTEEVTNQLISNDPCEMLASDEAPFEYQVEGDVNKVKYGHRFGAMLMVIPRQAYEAIGCFDERFKGWGGEDVSLLKALDTLWGKHKTIKTHLFHLWHPAIGNDYKTKMWEGQTRAEINSRLSIRYHYAYRKPSEMKDLVDEALGYMYRRLKGL